MAVDDVLSKHHLCVTEHMTKQVLAALVDFEVLVKGKGAKYDFG